MHVRTLVALVIVGFAIAAAPVAAADAPSDGGNCVWTSSSGSSVHAGVNPNDCKSSGGDWTPSG